MGGILAGAYFAGDSARASAERDRNARLAAAAREGFSDAALRDQTASMGPGALAIARRHDPLAEPGPPEQAANEPAPSEGAAKPVSLQAAAPHKITPPPARPFRLAADNTLYSSRELDCLSEAVYYEARGEGSAGQAAVAQVVLNRVRHPAFPKSVCGVVFQGVASHACQFSFVCDGSMRRNKEPAAWTRARTVASRALSGFVMASVGNATHFHVAGLGQTWSDRLRQVAQIGSHVFYRFTGQAGAPTTFLASVDGPAAEPPAADKPAFTDVSGLNAAGAGDARLVLASASTGPALRQAPASPAPPAAAQAKPVDAKPPAARAPTDSAAGSAGTDKLSF